MTESQKFLLVIGALLGFFSVAMGAFGAHSLKNKLSPEMLVIFETGARYQMYHAFAIWLAVWLSTTQQGNLPFWAGWSFIAGTVLFSGSLYALALTGIRLFGAITPIGGSLFLLGWLFLALAAYRQ